MLLAIARACSLATAVKRFDILPPQVSLIDRNGRLT
jgi:hypothetical protein